MPHTFDERAQKAFLTRIERGRSPAIAAEEVGFAMSTITRYLKSNRDFAAKYNDALDVVNGAVEEVLLEKALEGDFQSVKLWLHNRASNRWKDTKTINATVSGPGGSPIQVAQETTLTLRQVLADPSTRAGALEMIREIPAIGDGVIDVDGS